MCWRVWINSLKSCINSLPRRFFDTHNGFATPAMNDDTLLPFDLPAACRKKVTAAFDGGLISSDGGLVLLREEERRLGRPSGRLPPGPARSGSGYP